MISVAPHQSPQKILSKVQCILLITTAMRQESDVSSQTELVLELNAKSYEAKQCSHTSNATRRVDCLAASHRGGGGKQKNA